MASKRNPVKKTTSPSPAADFEAQADDEYEADFSGETHVPGAPSSTGRAPKATVTPISSLMRSVELAEDAEGVEFEADEAEGADALQDHEDDSSQDAGATAGELEAPAFGEFGPAETAAADQELEPVEDYDSSMTELDAPHDAATALPSPSDEGLLDAWYAEFGDPATIALMQQQPQLTETVAEVVIGRDDRVRIHNTTAYPWRTLCSLLVTAQDNTRWIGTGWLVGARTLITAGHVVYMHRHGGWAKNIEVIPGRNGGSRPYGSCTATHLRSVKGWTRKRKRSHDYGAVILPRNCDYGNRLGYFGYANLGFSSLMGLKGNLAGYPGDKPAGTQWFHARRIKLVTARRLVYNIDTAGGQSGSPVWRLKNGQRHAVGIHTNGSSLGNSATRITRPVFNNIKAWKRLGQ